MTFGEVLAHFKKTEGPEVLVALIDDDSTLRKALIAWPSVQITYATPSEDCRDDVSEPEKWSWMWSRTKFDKGQFGLVAGLKGQDVDSVLTRLRGLRLIYPDGTINVMAQQYLRSIVAQQLNKGKKGPAVQAVK